MTTLYGIKNCDTVKKARRWLEANDIPYAFHDFRADGIDQTIIDAWLSSVSWEKLLNKRSTTWRQLTDLHKDNLDQSRAIKLILENPTLIKRPVIMTESTCLIGFDETVYANHFGN